MGVGLLGGSLGLALKAAGSDFTIIGYGHRQSTLDTALELGAIDESITSPTEAAKDADWIILATPVGLFANLLTQIAPHLKPGAILTDVGSTKRSIVRAAESILPKSVHFVGSHPMAGSEKRGVEFARADLFKSGRCILTPTPQTDRSVLTDVDNFWKSIGMRTVQMSAEDHDHVICDISHLPHALAAALVAMQSDQALPLAGQGFLDTTRIAGGDGALWRDIFQDNQDNLKDSISRLRKHLDLLLQMLDQKQSEELANWLNESAQRRAKLLADKLRELHAE